MRYLTLGLVSGYLQSAGAASGHIDPVLRICLSKVTNCLTWVGGSRLMKSSLLVSSTYASFDKLLSFIRKQHCAGCEGRFLPPAVGSFAP